MAPQQPPTADELLNDPNVQQAMDQAWTDSQADDPVGRHEEGGWIYMEVATGKIAFRRAQRGATSAIDLSQPHLQPGFIVVGKFHTHPNPSREGWVSGPSAQDQIVDALHGVPELIRADDGDHFSGPVSRRGGIAGGPGYPP
jgi:hypothetical protein